MRTRITIDGEPVRLLDAVFHLRYLSYHFEKASEFTWESRELSHVCGIVLMELTASARDDSQRKLYEQLFRQYQKDNSLIVPNEDDWLLASKILSWLSRRRSVKGKLKRLPRGTSQRMALDVLIAVSARRWKATVVTDDWDDFKLIQRYCNTRIVKASDFFGR